ncbi:biotin synthase [Knoellia sinensis KCTC 19936]|uniref:Biotin synthase n=1 Tax=Knoellia sinensis KCTC 19936 TaxID=1385520 RepID=A0A0A0J264_9MICO|nr:biotin synthase [Knoellia sinensis KCTC 19936]
MFNSFDDLADQQLAGGVLTRDDALAILRSPDEALLSLVAAGGRLRRAAFGNTVKVNYLVNLKSGLCPEDCGYCSQRLGSTSDILKYSWLSEQETADQAAVGIKAGASRVCLVASGRGPSNRDIDRVSGMVDELKSQHPAVEVCVCLGLLKEGQAERLRDAGADAYNHNLNTAESRYEDICSTHTFDDRVDTVDKAQQAGLSACSGLIVGMGESDEELVDAMFALRDLGGDSIPVNFLMPFEGTPLEGTWELDPRRCIRILALARFACPTTEVRMSGGREMHLRTLQPLGLHLANSLFLGDYLTSEGQEATADLDLIKDSGFTVLGAGDDADPSNEERRDEVILRQRGAGTTSPANA